ncbi:MAG: hypothetical protein K6G55_01225 [Selenomonadaceae bacterium]|nr:hypothetical protein [Selenomonadaceae bacterium]
MRNLKRNILAGILSGALIFTGAQAFANPPEMPPESEEEWQEESEKNIGEWAKHLSEEYGVDSAQVEQAFNNHVHIGDIRMAAVLSKLSGKSFSEVLAMKVGWYQVAEKLGVSDEQIRTFMDKERDERFAERVGVDTNTLQSLMKDGYNPHDIGIAGAIAKAANKDIKTVLKKRTINNTWREVAESFGVDMRDIMPQGRHGQRFQGK